jgi:outer membrane lipoprotein-sorting protein
MRMRTGILALLAALSAPAESSRTAREIMQEVERRSFAKSFRYEGRVTVRKASGALDRKTWQYERFGPPGNSKMMLRFLDPAEIRGVALLTWNCPGKSADMWLYTPSIARTRRIAHQDRSARFAATGFTFEDLEEADISQWDYSGLQDAEENGEPCWRITARRNSAGGARAGRNWLWISKKKMTPLRIDKFRADRLQRRLSMRSLELKQGIWTPMSIEVADPSDQSLTTLQVIDARYDVRMSDSRFTLEALKGAR